jgi:hypothetical protein
MTKVHFITITYIHQVKVSAYLAKHLQLTVEEKPIPVMVRGSPPVMLPAVWLIAVMAGCISYM